MAVEAFGLQDNAAGESAEKTRRAINFMLQRGASIGSVLGGLVASADLEITYAGSGLKVTVAAGECVVPGNNSATQSGYYFRNTAAATFTPAAANGSNPRVEAVVARIFDESYEGVKNEGKLELLEGTAKAGATLTNLSGAPGQSGGPALPKNVLVLAYVLIPAAATTISNADIKNVAELLVPALGAVVAPAGAAYGAEVARAEGVEYEPSATRPTFVVVHAFTGAGSAGAAKFTLFVGGVEVTTVGGGSNSEKLQSHATLGFLCPPKVKWKATSVVIAGGGLLSSYLTL